MIIGKRPPTEDTPGIVGQEYFDKSSDTTYICTDVHHITTSVPGEHDAKYIWKVDSGSGGGSLSKPIPYEYMPEGYPRSEFGTVTVLEEQTITLVDMGGDYGADLPLCDFEAGKTYTIVYDGEAYECTAIDGGVVSQSNAGGVFYGNLSVMGDVPGGNAEAPFLGGVVGGEHMLQVLSADQPGDHTFAIYWEGEVAKPIAHKFLPEGYPWSEMQTVTVYEGVDVTFTQDADLYYVDFAPEETINIGDKVTVVWDGEEYKDLIAFELDGVVQVGAHPEAITEDMPFNIYYPTHGVIGYISTISAASTHSVKIVMDVKSVTPLDGEFISLSPLYITREEVDGETVYSAPIPFSKAVEMTSNTLMARLRLGNGETLSASCVGLVRRQTRALGNHMIMKFVGFDAYSTMTVDETVTYLIWTNGSIRELTTS